MILTSGTKKPKIHSSAYVAPTATISGDVTVGASCAILHGAIVVAEGAPVTIGADTVVMENAVLKASGGSVLEFPLAVGKNCVIGPHAYVVGARIADGCFVAGGARVFNGAHVGAASTVAIGAVVHVGTELPPGTLVPMQHVAHGKPATVYAPQQAPEVHAKLNFFADVFNLEPGDDVRARAAETYARFLRKTHAQDARLDDHRTVKAASAPRRGEEPPPTQSADVGKVVDVMMLELEEMERRREEAIRRQKGK
jgi:carbonic anhydrase/acetyltransferase-like protein (isoleucine patch superfamily)